MHVRPSVVSRLFRSRPSATRPFVTGLLLFSGAALAGCVDDSATPIDPARPPVTADLTDVTHTMEPTSQMEEAAEQQCLDDPGLAEGYVKAVDPSSQETLAEITVDCSEVRG